MKQRSEKNIRKKKVGIFDTIDLKIGNPNKNKFVFEVQKSNSNPISSPIFDKLKNINDLEIWTVNDSKVDITLNKVGASSLKKVFISTPIAIMRVHMVFGSVDKMINLLVENLFVINKGKGEPIYFRFLSNFEHITSESILKRHKNYLETMNIKMMNLETNKNKKILLSKEKKEINEKYDVIKNYYKIHNEKYYENNIFNKIDYHISKMIIMKDFLLKEITKTILEQEELNSSQGGV